MKKIVFFTQLFYPDITTTATILTDLVEDLVSYGMDAEVVCAQPTYLVKGRLPKVQSYHGIKIRRVWSFLFDKNKIIGRILNSTSCFLSMLPRLFSTTPNALLVFNTNPALLPLLGFIVTKLRSQKYVVLIHDIWPELPANAGIIKNGGFLYKLIYFTSKLFLKNAHGIVVISEAMKNLILNRVPQKQDEIYVIPNWADDRRVYPVARQNNRLIENLGLQHKKVVMYSGNLGRYQPLEVMIRAAKELKNRKNIKFIFAGEGGKKQKIQKMANSINLNNIIFIPFQSLERLAESLSIADVSLMGIYPKNEGVIMPSKLYALLAIGRPIICVSDPTSEVVEILARSGSGLYSAIDDPKELVKKIVGLIDNPKKARKMGLNGRTYFLEHYERKSITKKWNELLNKILHSATDVENGPCTISSESPQVSIIERTHRFSYDQSSTRYIPR